MKKPTVQSLKKKAWKLCSELVRRGEADDNGYVSCVTCGAVKHWKNGDAGHFLDGRRNSIYFDRRGIHFQCKGCNGNLRDGNISRNKEATARSYKKYMLKRYGRKVVDEIKYNKENVSKQFSVPELEKLIIDLLEGLMHLQ